MPSNLQIILTTPAAASVSVQTQKSTVSSLVIGQKATAASLASIGDVIAVAPKDGDLSRIRPPSLLWLARVAG